ncbi:MAG TPA: DUF86 domain-containing protein [Elusimicrobiota bacterium]|jgi:uncharacterized protein with HEPN domain|nr:DUF86 domain-containing protein [Elusimicrobiota bacterium]
MPRDFKVYLDDILEATERILRYTAGAAEFARDERTLDAVVRNLEVIGEAAKGIPADVRKAHPQVEWKKLAGLRDILIHEYFGVDAAIIKDIVKNKLPDLKSNIRAIIKKESGKK